VGLVEVQALRATQELLEMQAPKVITVMLATEVQVAQPVVADLQVQSLQD